MSQTMQSGGWVNAASRPARAEAHTTTSYPASRIAPWSRRETHSSSSITSTSPRDIGNTLSRVGSVGASRRTFGPARPGLVRLRVPAKLRLVSGPSRVLVAMSGGVDSSVAAARLLDEGHEVVGVTLHLWDYPDDGSVRGRCCA